jgi:tetratricopeptide (TPR) repeat protein
MRGAWRYARAMALVGTNRLKEADRELAELRKVVADPALDGLVTFSANTGRAVLRIAPEVVAGRLAAARKDWDRALLHLERAVRYEDGLIYTEPPDWHDPVRRTLAAVLLQAGRPDEAEAVYWEDLKKHPENGWSLAGLARALRAQKKDEAAAEIEERFRTAWADADAALREQYTD